ncbi:hypothetical protein B0H15DRAFT_370437 [Mycena belliarum]|uniref:Uncharacterized protein n=1 Tax=Mycena belliarum TaxID=1033014 RepID=A0AAD6U0V2_9AGAR|nr:hypothetical protein B0H15DRAFT_370437 [Mycena belliae]
MGGPLVVVGVVFLFCFCFCFLVVLVFAALFSCSACLADCAGTRNAREIMAGRTVGTFLLRHPISSESVFFAVSAQLNYGERVSADNSPFLRVRRLLECAMYVYVFIFPFPPNRWLDLPPFPRPPGLLPGLSLTQTRNPPRRNDRRGRGVRTCDRPSAPFPPLPPAPKITRRRLPSPGQLPNALIRGSRPDKEVFAPDMG